ncbi:zinc ABC transporter substrate-binding protein, partial [archaeon]|nr:zinc ABC transporter substrate-binding protein [archaeon]
MIRWSLPLCLAILLASYVAAALPQGKKLVVVATIPPLAALARAVGGDRVEVVYIVPGTSDPHQYAPTPRDIELASSCDLFIEVGKEPFLKSLPAERGRERITWSDWMKAGLKVEGGNPHYIWLYPSNAVKAARLIAEKLAELDPAGAHEYASRAATFEEAVGELVEWCKSYIRAHGAEGAAVVAVGAHFVPLLEFLGFKVVGPLLESEGRSPS